VSSDIKKRVLKDLISHLQDKGKVPKLDDLKTPSGQFEYTGSMLPEYPIGITPAFKELLEKIQKAPSRKPRGTEGEFYPAKIKRSPASPANPLIIGTRTPTRPRSPKLKQQGTERNIAEMQEKDAAEGSTIVIANPKGGDSPIRDALAARVARLGTGVKPRTTLQTTPQNPSNIDLTPDQIKQKNQLERGIEKLQREKNKLSSDVTAQSRGSLDPPVTTQTVKRPPLEPGQMKRFDEDAVRILPSERLGTVKGPSGNIDSILAIDNSVDDLRNTIKNQRKRLQDLREEYKNTNTENLGNVGKDVIETNKKQIQKRGKALQRAIDQNIQKGRDLRKRKNRIMRDEADLRKTEKLEELRTEYKTTRSKYTKRRIENQAAQINSTANKKARAQTVENDVKKGHEIDKEIKNKVDKINEIQPVKPEFRAPDETGIAGINKKLEELRIEYITATPARRKQIQERAAELNFTPIEEVDRKTITGDMTKILREKISPDSPPRIIKEDQAQRQLPFQIPPRTRKEPVDDIDVFPNVVGKSDDPRNPVEKQRIDAPFGPDPKNEDEVFQFEYQKAIDEGDSHFEAIEKAEDKVDEIFGKGLTPSQIRDMSLSSSVDYEDTQSVRELARKAIAETDESASDMAEAILQSEVPLHKIIKKKGGQVGKPKRKIKKTMRGNDLVAMMYD